MPSAISLVTLLTDFGERDFFVPSMKGVMMGINPQLRVVDLSHQIPAQDVEQAAFFLKSSYRYFPEGTVHVVVVDPGSRKSSSPIARDHFPIFFHCSR